MQKYVRECAERVEKITSAKLNENWLRLIHGYWATTLARILLVAQSYKHGGAFVILPDDSPSGLAFKYQITYDRIAKALPRLFKTFIETESNHERMKDLRRKDEMSVNLHLAMSINETEMEDTNDEIAGAVRTVASMSRIDGLVVLDSALGVKGFGTEIVADGKPSAIFSAGDELGSENFLRLVNYDQYGTRHRSMFKLCHLRPGAIGFIVSQDGDVRAAFNVGTKIILWENIALRYSPPLETSRAKKAFGSKGR